MAKLQLLKNDNVLASIEFDRIQVVDDNNNVLADLDSHGRIYAGAIGFTNNADPSFDGRSHLYQERSTGRVMSATANNLTNPEASGATNREVLRAEPE